MRRPLSSKFTIMILSRRKAVGLPIGLLLGGIGLARMAASQPPFKRVAELEPVTPNPSPTWRRGDVTLVPSRLVALFGEPTDESWDSESVGGYYFESLEGWRVAVYYRANDVEEPAMSKLKKKFWASKRAFEFGIGAGKSANVPMFRDWIEKAVR
jgi:hypothetical protein